MTHSTRSTRSTRRLPAAATSAVLAGGLVFSGASAAVAHDRDGQGPRGDDDAPRHGWYGEHHRGAVRPAPVMPEAYDLARHFDRMSGAPLEQAFLAEMIGHHQMAVQMARIELEKGQRTELRALAQKIIDDQQAEITQLTGWLRQWYGLTREQALAAAPEQVRLLTEHMDEMSQGEMMMPLMDAAPGAETDKQFLRHMIPHHQTAIITTRAAIDGFTHPELQQAGGKIIVSQAGEVQLMRFWLHAWFGAGNQRWQHH